MDIQWGLILPVVILQLILALIGLISLAKTAPESVRGPKWIWVLVILFGNIIGSVAYFAVGRRGQG
ncbi:phospholipase D-like protein [Fontibacillus phaseoli]|uniref:Phospholipase D-like protein n=1 Tax=Fontibacillus phaseoli TaxID=1416533 RepID=A0A369AXT7_9BACL|nr:PLDc N-terminal domain-containing protein [Fontibacillus phaseoli]RCX13905.1 phospholipase D-like protein [Fontibacillus phaseoli]